MHKGILTNKELLVNLERYKSEYYTRGKAIEVYHILNTNSDCLSFTNESDYKMFYEQMEILRRCESIMDKEKYATTFAGALIKLMLILHRIDDE